MLKTTNNDLINDSYGIQDFGKKVVQNLVKNPKKINTKGVLQGRPMDSSPLSNLLLKGCDYISFKNKKLTLEELPALCNKFLDYYNSSYHDTYTFLTEKMTANSTIKKIENEETISKLKELETTELTEIESDGQQHIHLYDEWYSLGDYYQKTIDDLGDDIFEKSTLPAFNELNYRSLGSTKNITESIEDEREENEKNRKSAILFEGFYNENTAKEQKLLLMDKKLVDNIEICERGHAI